MTAAFHWGKPWWQLPRQRIYEVRFNMSLKYSEAFNDPKIARHLADHITRTSRKTVRFMEVCGTHTHAIGRGGFGYVYRAREELTGEAVAIKELISSLVSDPRMVPGRIGLRKVFTDPALPAALPAAH